MIPEEIGAWRTQALEDHYGLGQGWIANWRPVNDVNVGMIGHLRHGSFDHDGGWLSDPSRGIEYAADPHPTEPDGPWNFTDSSNVTIDARLKGTTDAGWEWIGAAKAGIKFSFHKDEAVVLTVGDSDEQHIQDPNALKQELIDAHNKGNGERMHLGETVITAVRLAKSGFLIVSSAGGGEVHATTDVTISPQNVDLAKLSGAINFAKEHKTASVDQLQQFAVAFQGITLVRAGWRFIPWFLRPNRASAHPAEGVLPLDDEPADENEWFVRFPS